MSRSARVDENGMVETGFTEGEMEENRDEETRYCLEYIDEAVDTTKDDIKLAIWKRLGRLIRGLITERDRIREVLKECRNCAEADCTQVSGGLGCKFLEE